MSILDKEKILKRVKKLRQEIDQLRYQYHVLDNPSVSDEVYDSLMRELRQLEEQYPEIKTSDSPSQRVGGEPLPEFRKVKHKVRQWSLDDAFSFDEVKKWEEKILRILTKQLTVNKFQQNYCAEIKIDGLKIVLTYKKGLLVQASTRGDGIIGEDVTEQVKTIQSIPLRLNKSIDIIAVGEAWMHKKELEKINKERAEKNLPLFANSRNAAAGSIRQLDPKITASRKLDSFIYDIDYISEAKLQKNKSLASDLPKTQIEELELLKELGFKVNPNYKLCQNLTEVQEFFKLWEDKRNKQEYAIDGVVIKINSNELQKILGYTGKSPRWALAWKFIPEKVTTIVEDIKVQVGRTGALTPVAHLRPVKVAGSVISRATLHNEDEIKRLDLRIGDTVVIHKAGDVIPEVVEVLKNLRTGREKKFKMPDKCPICGGKIIREILEARLPKKETWPLSTKTAQRGRASDRASSRTSAAHYCLNKKCFAIEKENIIHFVSKKGFDIEGLGEKIVAQLMNEGLISNAADIFELTEGDLEPLERFAQKSAQNLIAAIEKSKTIELPKFLYALGIRHVGEETTVLITRELSRLITQIWHAKVKIQNIRDIISLFPKISVGDWMSIKGIGQKSARSLQEWFANKNNLKLLEKMEKLGVKIIMPEDRSLKSQSKLKGLTFVLTGELKDFTREEAKDIIRKAGGDVSSSVSKKTDYVIAGKNPGSKYDKAKNLNVKIISESDFKKMLE